MLDTLDTAAVRAWAEAALGALEAARAEIDALNVFPVPDSDTGTNLCLTVRAGMAALAAVTGTEPADAHDALAQLSRGAVLGARGNSGAIVAQLLRGLAEAVPPGRPVGVAELRSGLARGAELAYAAVATPVEGTVLTVARAAAEAPGDGSLAGTARAAVTAASAALERTPQQLDPLRRAGVVDAGGQGLVLVLDALARVAAGQPPGAARLAPRPVRTPREQPGAGGPAYGSDESHGGYQYEVQYLLEAGESAADELRERLAALGDSVVVAGTGGGTWTVHVHADDIGAAIEAGVRAGPTSSIRVVRFADQIGGSAPGAFAVVALVEGDGLAQLFAREGVHVVADPAPDVARVVVAAEVTGAAEVVLLPNDSDAGGLAEAAAERLRAAGTRVVVIPARSPVQGLAAVAVHDGKRRFDDDVVAMAEAAAATRFAQVCVAEGPALTSVGMCRAGDVLGLIEGDVVEIGADVGAVALALLDRLLGVGGELVTVLVGAGAPAGVDDAIARRVRERSPLTDVCTYRTGQRDLRLILGVE